MTTNHNNQVGRFGEGLAVKYLLKKDYKIIGQNIRAGRDEIDILALDKDYLVFVEVRTRTSILFGPACEAMSYFKATKIKRGAAAFLRLERAESLGIRFKDIRFDFISIDISKKEKTAKIRLYQDII